ncbi:hypothetical protein PT274_01885 [Leuconostocaceae bacterium ESL0958]|nr:hypothetical protein [Leuconostocaceae bacterium ESL0958]
MEVKGQTILDQIAEQTYAAETMTGKAGQAIDLDSLFASFATLAKRNDIGRAALVLDGGIEAGGSVFALEINAINLPLRYANQEKKLIYPEENYELQVYQVVDNPYISKSQLKIQKAASLSAYQDDPETVQQKMAAWFAEMVDLIQENQNLAEEADQETAAAAEKEGKQAKSE